MHSNSTARRDSSSGHLPRSLLVYAGHRLKYHFFQKFSLLMQLHHGPKGFPSQMPLGVGVLRGSCITGYKNLGSVLKNHLRWLTTVWRVENSPPFNFLVNAQNYFFFCCLLLVHKRGQGTRSFDGIFSGFRYDKGKVCIQAKWPISAGAYPGFLSMK